MKRAHFEDDGQDFLSWSVDDQGYVIEGELLKTRGDYRIAASLSSDPMLRELAMLAEVLYQVHQQRFAPCSEPLARGTRGLIVAAAAWVTGGQGRPGV